MSPLVRLNVLPLLAVPMFTLLDFTNNVLLISEFLIVAPAVISVSVSIFTLSRVAAAEIVREVLNVA